MMDASISLNVLPWDSDFFGFPVARLAGSSLHESQLPAIESWCRAQRVRCLYFLADGSSPDTLKAAHAGGFQFADMRMVFERPLAGLADRDSKAACIRSARKEELHLLQAMAGELHKNTRFFKDTHFPRERAAELYAEWLRRSFEDPKCAVLTAANSSGRSCGYVTCEIGDAEGTGRIGLIGVDESWRGQGMGAALVRAALAWLSSAGASRVQVATQADNLVAMRLYTAHGFMPVEAGAWFHRWYGSS